MLNDLQLEILSDAIRPLFQYLEREVVLDIARRVQKTMTYTRTAELMAMDMQKMGYAPNKIRADVMKVLRADEAYQKAVEANTIAYKKEIKKLIDETVKQAAEVGNDIVANAGNMSWVDDMSVWESAGRELTDNSFLHDLQKAIAEQTVEEMVNLTRTMGFKTMSGYEAVANAYRNELDKAVIKICTGTFSQEKVLNDVIHNLAQSGLRSIDYASGYSMQIDTAAKNAIRTGCGQISAKIMDENLIRTGQNLVYVSKHWGARNEGIGVDNHEMWQGKVYFIKPGEDYAEEAKRIGQDRIMDIWYSTGYSPDGSHVNNPLGLHGYNCRHSHRVWFLGTSTLPEEQPEPSPVKVNGKEYDYSAMTRRMRYLERDIRDLKREQIAREALRLPCTEINAKIKQKTREYREFCNKCNVPERTTNLRVDSTASDVTKTRAHKEYERIKKDVSVPKITDKKVQKAYDDFEKVLLTSNGNANLVNNMLIYQDSTDWIYDEKLEAPFVYRPAEDAIIYNPNANNYELYDMNYVQSHELAHRMDVKEYRCWNNIDFQKAIAYGKQIVYDNIVEVEKLMAQGGKCRYDMAFSDILSALTDGEINDILTATHDSEYWLIENMKAMEIFANLSSIEVNAYASKSILERLLPELLEAYERML